MWLCPDACIRGITVHVGGVGVKVTRPSTLELRWAAPRAHIAPLAVRPEYLLYTSAHWARGGVKKYWGGRRSDVVPKRDQAPTNDFKMPPRHSQNDPDPVHDPEVYPEVYPKAYPKTYPESCNATMGPQEDPSSSINVCDFADFLINFA